MKMGKKGFWFTEKFTPYEEHKHFAKKYIVKKKTKFQDAAIVDTYTFKKCLVLDGEVQSSEVDEFIYHESLVHPAMLLHPSPKKILILGGGEGSTLREILKHKSVKKAVMVDIDGEVVEFCKKHLKSFHKNAFSDSRTEVIIDDAKKYLENTKESFDIIISDLPCPIQKGPACYLYTKEFYNMLKTKLSKNGIFVAQAGSGYLGQLDFHTTLSNTLSKVFKTVNSFTSFVSSYDVPWAFIIATNNKNQDPLNLSKEKVDKLITNRIKGNLYFYDGITHLGIFNLPKHIRKSIQTQKTIITNKKLFYFYK